VIVGDFDILGIARNPSEADSELIIDSDAELAFSVAPQRFQAIAWWDAQILQFLCSIDSV
jgi:hypothetical protein